MVARYGDFVLYRPPLKATTLLLWAGPFLLLLAGVIVLCRGLRRRSLAAIPLTEQERARAAALSIIPTSTGAARAIGEVLPHLKGRLDGFAMRVPTPDGSVVDLVATVKGTPSVDEINAAMKAASTGAMAGILGYSEDPIVSRDVIGDSHSSLFDAPLTMVMGNQVKVISWYDNEWGYSCRVVDLAQKLLP